MRLGVLDVGSNTVHLLIVDAHPGARPWAAHSHKTELRLTDLLRKDGAISDEGVGRLAASVLEATRLAEDKGVGDFLAFGTSALRRATNAQEVIDLIHGQTGVALQVLPG